MQIVHATGFEPARPQPIELESNPLDHSGIHASRHRFLLRVKWAPILKSVSCIDVGTLHGQKQQTVPEQTR